MGREPHRSEFAGFTLLELIVVVTLLGIISMTVVPVFVGSMSSLQLKNTSNDVVALLNFVQQRAVSESREHRIYFDDEAGEYWVEILAGYDEDNEKIFREVSASYGEIHELSSNLSFERVRMPKDRDRNGLYYVSCYPNGATDRGQITIQDERNFRDRFRIEILGAMGKVEIDKPGDY